MSFYAVGVGRTPGVYQTWNDCQAQTKGVSRAAFKKFASRSEAVEYVARYASGGEPGGATKRKAEDPVAGESAAKRVRVAEIEVYTDGNCRNNGRASARAGSGVYFVRDGKTETIVSGVPGAQTNNRAEIYALLLALDATLDSDAICIMPDSEYVAKSLTDPTWLAHWRTHEWRKHGGSRGAVANVDLWTLAARLLDKRRLAGRAEPRVQWVKAHAEIAGNERADKLADAGMASRVLELKTLT